MRAAVRYLMSYQTNDCPVPYLRAFDQGWSSLSTVHQGWLGAVPVGAIEVEGHFLEQHGEVVNRVRRAGSDLRVRVERPTSTMLATGDPGALAVSDVHDVLEAITERFSIGWTPRLPGLSEEHSAAAISEDRRRAHLKALAVDFLLSKADTLVAADWSEIEGDLSSGLYSEALGALLRTSRAAGVALPEAASGDLQRMRVELRADGL